jgi:hypothetical protein
MAVACVIASSGPVDAQKARKAVHAQFAMDNVQGVPLELLVRHLFQRNYRRLSRTLRRCRNISATISPSAKSPSSA